MAIEKYELILNLLFRVWSLQKCKGDNQFLKMCYLVTKISLLMLDVFSVCSPSIPQQLRDLKTTIKWLWLLLIALCIIQFAKCMM